MITYFQFDDNLSSIRLKGLPFMVTKMTQAFSICWYVIIMLFIVVIDG